MAGGIIMNMRRQVSLGLLIMLAVTVSAAGQERIPVGTFSSIAVRSGCRIVLRHGPSQQVTLRRGSLEFTSAATEDGTLVIEGHRHGSPRGYRAEVEIVTPVIEALSVDSGGTIESQPGFPPQQTIDVAVSNGGTIDIRSIAAARVNASVSQGGRIFTKPGQSLRASVEQGGIITWWGHPVVESSTRHGGVITEGDEADASKPLSDLSPEFALPPVPPIPPVPPVPPH